MPSRFYSTNEIFLKVWTEMSMCEQSSFILSTSSSNFSAMARLGVLALNDPDTLTNSSASLWALKERTKLVTCVTSSFSASTHVPMTYSSRSLASLRSSFLDLRVWPAVGVHTALYTSPHMTDENSSSYTNFHFSDWQFEKAILPNRRFLV